MRRTWRLGWPALTARRATVRTYVGPEGARYTRVVSRLERAIPLLVAGAIGLLIGGVL